MDRRQLVDALKRTAPAVAKTAHLPILYGVRIDAAAQVDFTCTNLDLTIEHTADADITTPGVAVVPATLLARIVGAMDATTVELELIDGELIATGDTAVATLRTIPTQEWPLLPDIDGTTIELHAEQVGQLRSIIYALSRDTSRPLFNGVAFIDGNAVACDHYRLAHVTMPGPDNGAVVPGDLMRSALDITDAHAEIVFGAGSVAWHAGGTTVRGQLTPGEYAKWRNVLPPTPTETVKVNVAEFAAALARTAALAADGRTMVTFDGDTALIERRSPDEGTTSDTITTSGVAESMRFMFTGAFLAEGLKACTTSDIAIDIVNSSKAILFTSDDVTHLLMPIPHGVGGR